MNNVEEVKKRIEGLRKDIDLVNGMDVENWLNKHKRRDFKHFVLFPSLFAGSNIKK